MKMSFRRVRKSGPRSGEQGFSLLEVLIAASLLIIVFYGITQYYIRGRTQIDYEENRRKATAVAQNRLDGIRRDYTYDTLPALNGTTANFVVENKTYQVTHTIATDMAFLAAQTNATTITLTVRWPEKVGASTVTRSLTTATVLARGMP
jgi:type II secretory pathway pseudopilin PulG